MMHAAVNCFVNDARRKFVCASMGWRVRMSVTPYPRRKTGLPLRMTRTATPGAVVDFRGKKMASIWVEDTWAEASADKKSEIRSTAACQIFKGKPRKSGFARGQ